MMERLLVTTRFYIKLFLAACSGSMSFGRSMRKSAVLSPASYESGKAERKAEERRGRRYDYCPHIRGMNMREVMPVNR